MFGLIKRMPPALTHLLAAAGGALLLFLLPHSAPSSLSPVTITTLAGGETSYAFNPTGIAALVAFLVLLMGIAATLISMFLPSLARMAAIRVLPRDIASQAGLFLEEEISRVLSHLRTYGDASDRYLSSLMSGQANIVELPTPDQVRVTMNLLIQENERMRKTSVELKSQLFDSERRLKELKKDQSSVSEIGDAEPISGIASRQDFDDALRRAIATAEKSQRPLALVMCDITSLKAVSETYGPSVAGELVRLLAILITPSLRMGDMAARYNREKLAVILPGMSLADANQFAERTRTQLEGQFLTIRATQQQVGKMSASFGVVQWQPGEIAEALVVRANAAA